MPTNPFLLDEDEDTQQDAENVNFKQLRDYAKKLEKQVASASKELETLRGFKAEVEQQQRQASVAQVFKKVGLSEKHAGLFVKLNQDGEVSEEAVVQFAQEYELPRTQVEGETPADTPIQESFDDGQIQEIKPAEAGPTPGFAPAASAQGPTGSIVTDPEIAVKLMTENPAEYARLHAAGRIKLPKLPGAATSRLPGT